MGLRRLGSLAAFAGALLAVSCGQLPTSPLPSSRVALPEGLYHPPPSGAGKIPLSAAMVLSPGFAPERFTARDTSRVYHVDMEPALSGALSRLLSDTFASARAGSAAAPDAQLEVRPFVRISVSISQSVFSETIIAAATVYLLVTDPHNAADLEEFQRRSSESAVGGAPWDVGGFYTGFRAGADNSALLAKLIAGALAADLSRLSDDLHQAALGERLARAQERRPATPDQMVPTIPYVPNQLGGAPTASP